GDADRGGRPRGERNPADLQGRRHLLRADGHALRLEVDRLRAEDLLHHAAEGGGCGGKGGGIISPPLAGGDEEEGLRGEAAQETASRKLEQKDSSAPGGARPLPFIPSRKERGKSIAASHAAYSHHGQLDRDVVAGGVRVGADLVGFFHQRL